MNPTQPPKESFATFALRSLSDAVYRLPRLFFYPQAFLLLACLLYTAKTLEFDPDRNNLVGEDKKYHQNFVRFKREFPLQDELVVVAESENQEKNRQFIERLGARLDLETNVFAEVFYKGDLKLLGSKALLLLEEDDLKELLRTLRDYQPFIEQFTRASNLTTLFSLVNRQFFTARRDTNAQNLALLKALPVLHRIIEQASDSFKRPGTPPSPGINALFNGGPEAESQMYITFAKGRIYLATARARTAKQKTEAVERLRELVQQTAVEVPGLNVGLTGEPVLEHDEMMQSKRDTTLATIVSLVLCALIFIYGYQETGRPIKATICLVFGLVYTMAFAMFAIGHLNILTVTFLPMLIGLAIDYGVHLITRYEEELRRGRKEQAALQKAMVFTGRGIFTGALTTAVAFLAMAVTNFKGIQEMGVISGAGLIICLVPMMTLLPVLLLRGQQNVIDHEHGLEIDRRAQLEMVWLQRPVLVTLLTALLCGLALTQFPKVHFDYDLRNMQSEGLPAVEFEKKLIASASRSVLYAAVVTDSLEQALSMEEKIKRLPAVASVNFAGIDLLSRCLTEDQAQKLALVREIKNAVAPLRFAGPDPAPVNIPELSLTLWSLQGYLGNAVEDPAVKEDSALLRQLTALRAAIGEWRKRMLGGDPREVSAKLAAFQQALFEDIQTTFQALQNQDDRSRLRVEDLPPGVRNRFIGKSGRKYLLQVYPKHDIWQRENQQEFVRQLRHIDPNVTGTPVQLYEYTNLLKKSYEEAAWYSLAAIAIMVLVHFRSPVCVILALLPVLVGTAWTAGLMGVLGVPFNPANIMMLPLVIGIGVTNGIHILNRFAEEQTPSILAKSTGKAVLVSGLTTIAGFGSLMLAKHQGIQSLGYVMAIGVAGCMAAGLTFLPAVLNLLIRAGWTIKKPSDEYAQTTLGQEEPR